MATRGYETFRALKAGGIQQVQRRTGAVAMPVTTRVVPIGHGVDTGGPTLSFAPTTPTGLSPTGGATATGYYSPYTPSSGTVAALGNQGCNLITNPTARAICMAGVAVGSEVLFGGGGGASSSSPLTGACPPGYVPDGAGGCRIAGVGSYLPGDIGMQDTGWTPIAGLYGVGVTPIAVQSARRACPAGFVLGKDGVCYESLARTQRAHNPGARPMLTGGDVNALRRAKSLQKKIGKLTSSYGKKACRCSSPRKKACK